MPDAQIAALERRRDQLRSQLASVGEMRAGALTVRFRRCGTAGCHCAKPGDPGHGPALSLTRQRNGKTITRVIPAPAEAETRVQIAACRRFRQWVTDLVEVSTALCEARLAAGREQTGGAAKKGALKKSSPLRSTPKSKRSPDPERSARRISRPSSKPPAAGCSTSPPGPSSAV